VTKRIPTRVGDVLILRTRRSFIVYAVGAIAQDGQQDFGSHAFPTHVTDDAAALALAKSLRRPSSRVFLADIDTGEWFEIADV
jgi:hypothetical protein